jgi:hypothetical protein
VFGLVMIVILIVRADGVASLLGLGRGSSGRAKAPPVMASVQEPAAAVSGMDTERAPA